MEGRERKEAEINTAQKNFKIGEINLYNTLCNATVLYKTFLQA
jgi:hypothetical protein